MVDLTVSVCIASRGRPEELKYTIGKARELATEPGTRFVVALDQDDEAVLRYNFSEPCDVNYSVHPRENSLGAKYNRAAGLASKDTSVFVLGVDDAFMACEGWDRKLLDAASTFEDGFGAILFGSEPSPWNLPDGIAVTRRWIEEVGFFCPDYFPFWWHDTWIDELAKMTGRYVWADIKWDKHGSSEVNGHKTTRMREVSWWAAFFDWTRAMRVVQAAGLLHKLDYPRWLRSQKLSDLPVMAAMLKERNRNVLVNGAAYEAQYGAVSEPDGGYTALRARAEGMMK